MMVNPYSPPSQTPGRHFSWRSITAGLLGVGFLIVVAVNYIFATRLSISLYNSFMHVVFILSPIATIGHLRILLCGTKADMKLVSNLLLVPIIGIPLAFAISWIPYFSNNPYETFALTNLYFGQLGWMQWFWLVVLGILPVATIFTRVRQSYFVLPTLAFTAIITHIHNAYWVWTLCHTPE